MKKSIKYKEAFDGTLANAIARASEPTDEYQPAFGTQINMEAMTKEQHANKHKMPRIECKWSQSQQRE